MRVSSHSLLFFSLGDRNLVLKKGHVSEQARYNIMGVEYVVYNIMAVEYVVYYGSRVYSKFLEEEEASHGHSPFLFRLYR